MARYKHPHRKSKLIKANNRTKWAPIFAIMKKFGVGKKVHPSRFSQQRSWRRTKLKL